MSASISLSQFSMPKENYVNVAMQMVPDSKASDTASSTKA
jgi:hypothetical protein